jgi:hypothetical protein
LARRQTPRPRRDVSYSHVAVKDEPPPAKALAERDRVFSQPVSRDEQLFGDPPIGRRAIDRAAAPPERRRVELDPGKIARIMVARAKRMAANGGVVR